MLAIMLFKRKLDILFIYLFLIFFSDQLYGQKYIFEGDPELIYEKGNFKQNYSTGLFFYKTNQWDLAIEFFLKCKELTRKNTIHYKKLAWCFVYTKEYDQALENINKIKNRKHKKLVQLLIKDLKRLPKRKKIDKKQIDQMFREKQDLVLRAKRKNIELGKLLVNNYGP